jgi:hypothetical protein
MAMHGRVAVMALTFSTLMFTAHAQEVASGPAPREQLKQYVGDLQKNPSDDALREKIIKLGLTLDPKPAIPSEVQEYLGRGGQAFEDAKAAIKNGKTDEAKQELALAAEAFAKASVLAPWMADYYRDLGSAQDAAKDYKDAMKNYQFYVEATADTTEADRFRQRIGALKYELDKERTAEAAENARHEAERQAELRRQLAVSAQQARETELRQKLAGIWRVTTGADWWNKRTRDLNYRCFHSTFSIENGNLVVTEHTDETCTFTPGAPPASRAGDTSVVFQALLEGTAATKWAPTPGWGERYQINSDFTAIVHDRFNPNAPGGIEHWGILTRVAN